MKTKLFAGFIVVAALATAGFAWQYATDVKAEAQSKGCCYPGAECCVAGLPCCATGVCCDEAATARCLDRTGVYPVAPLGPFFASHSSPPDSFALAFVDRLLHESCRTHLRCRIPQIRERGAMN